MLFEAPGPPGGHAGRPRRGLRAGPTGRRLPGADEAPRGGPARHARRASPRPPPTGRSWPAARCVVVVGEASQRARAGARRRTRRRTRDAVAAARAQVERLVASGVARGEAARRVAAATGIGRRGLYGADGRPLGSARTWTDRAPPACRSSAPCRRSRASWCWRRSRISLVDDRPRLGRRRRSRRSSSWSRRSAILGLAWVVGLSTERLGALTGPAGRRHPQRDLRQHRRADHRLLRPAGRAHRRREGLDHRLDHRQPAARAGRERARRRPPQRHPALRPAGRRLERGAPGASPRSASSSRRSSPSAPGPGEQGTITEESVLVAILLIVGYVLSLVFQFTNSSRTLGGHEPAAEHGGPGLEPERGDRRAPRRGRPAGRPVRDPGRARSSRSSRPSGCPRSSSA